MPQKASLPAATTTALAVSSLNTHHEALEKEYQWLVKQINKKQTELKNFGEQMRSVATEIFERGNHNFNKLIALDTEIHTLFDEILTTRKLGKQTRKSIVGIYHNLQVMGIISPKANHEEKEQDLEEWFEPNQSENDFNSSQSKHDEPERKGQQKLEFAATSRTDESRKIRQIFIRLAEIFHPDKVVSSEMENSYTEIMKQINQAYQQKDLAGLLEIERQHLQGESSESNSQDNLSQKCSRQSAENKLLLTQYEALKQELRQLKNSAEGVMVSDYRKAVRAGIDPIEQMLLQVKAEVKALVEIRNFVKDFHEQKMTIKEFLCGPAALGQMNHEIMEELLKQMLEELGVRVMF